MGSKLVGAGSLPVAHAPGGWRVCDSGSRLMIDSVRQPIAHTVGIDGVDRANAALIAAAPDLLAALRALLSAKYGGDAFDRARADRAEFVARMAIAKAEGHQ